MKTGYISRHTGTTPISAAYCRRVRRSRNASRSRGRAGQHGPQHSPKKRPNGCTISPLRYIARPASTGGSSAPKPQVFSTRRNFEAALGRRKKRPCEAAASVVMACPAICGAPRIASRRLASPASRSPISSRQMPRPLRKRSTAARARSANPSARSSHKASLALRGSNSFSQ